MHRRPALFLAVVVAVGFGTAGPWGATPVAAAAPVEGPVFNDPTGSEDQQMAIMDTIMRQIDGTKKGAIIRMAFYSFTIHKFADKLIAAHKRGVAVRLIMDDHEIYPAWERMVEELGTNPGASSFAVLCHGACLTENEPSYMHTKVYMFSATGGKPYVVSVSSANPTYFQARRGWNNGYTMVGDSILYAAFQKNFEMLTAGARNRNQPTTSPEAYFTATSGKHKVYFFPKGGTGALNDPMYQILKNIRCTGTAPGYGTSGRTVIKVAMYQWSVLRVRLADILWSLDNQGCSVGIMFDPTRVDPAVLRSLTKPGGKFGGPSIAPAATDENHDGVVDQMIHDKYVLIDGVYAGDTSSKVVFTGSANWTNNSLHYNDEFMIRVMSESTHAAFLKHYAKVRDFAKASIGTATPLVSATGRKRVTSIMARNQLLNEWLPAGGG